MLDLIQMKNRLKRRSLSIFSSAKKSKVNTAISPKITMKSALKNALQNKFFKANGPIDTTDVYESDSSDTDWE
jgi:hypothetical protein